jgi:hypothetical protein
MTIIEKIIRFYDTKIRMKSVWLTLTIALLLTLWKGIDYNVLIVILSCIIYILLEYTENKSCVW